MEYVDLNGVKVSRLGMGNMRLPRSIAKLGGIDYKRAERIISTAQELGINYYDAAIVYLGSEEFLGKALVKRYDRDSFHIATKYYALGHPDYRKAFENQLRRLKVDFIDFYLIHGLTDSSYKTYTNKGSIEFFQRMKEEGKIGQFGFSTHASVKTSRRFADEHEWDFAQIQFNYYDWVNGTAKEEYELFEERGIPLVIMEPVRGGKLAKFAGDAAEMRSLQPDWSAASWAMRWVKRFDNAKVILSGMSNLEQLTDNVATFNGRALNAREVELVLKSCGAIRESMAAPCTACRYCTESCPSGIDIPAAMEAFNELATGNKAAVEEQLEWLEKGPETCVGCGACTQHCPQGIDIPSIMEKLANRS